MLPWDHWPKPLQPFPTIKEPTDLGIERGLDADPKMRHTALRWSAVERPEQDRNRWVNLLLTVGGVHVILTGLPALYLSV